MCRQLCTSFKRAGAKMNTLLDTQDISKIAEYYGAKQKIKRELQALSLSFITFKELKCLIYLCCDKLSTINDIIDELNIFMLENCLNDNTSLNLFGVGSKSEIGVMLSIGNEKLFVGTAPHNDKQNKNGAKQ